MEQIRVTFSDETMDALERYTREQHRGDRDAAVQDLLNRWIHTRN
jgi:hypothetical protein